MAGELRILLLLYHYVLFNYEKFAGLSFILSDAHFLKCCLAINKHQTDPCLQDVRKHADTYISFMHSLSSIRSDTHPIYRTNPTIASLR